MLRSRLLRTSLAAGAVVVMMAPPALARSGPVRDGRTDTVRLHHAMSSAFGGRVRANNGDYVNVTLSAAYGADAQRLQTWADFMANLQHGPELGRMTVYVAPLAEVFRICGSGADGCYSTSPARLTIHGDGADPAYVRLVAAHEYGHHLDASRRNDPWDASTWGPKHWATYEDVCHRTRAGTAFPGNQGRNYSRNPDEAWAEAYAVLNGYQWESQSFDDSFKPDAGALRVMKLDIFSPWNGRRVLRYRGGRSRRIVKLPEPLDGKLSVKLSAAAGASDVNLYTVVNGRRKLLKRARHRGSTTRLRYTICGEYPLQLKVIPRRGSGRWRMTVLEP